MHTDFLAPMAANSPVIAKRSYPYYNDETLRTAGKDLECGDLSPLLPLWRLVAKAGPPPAARESWTPSGLRRRQVACRKRGRVRALQSGCGLAAVGFPCFSFHRLGSELALVQVQDPIRARGRVRIVRDHQNRFALFTIERLQQAKDFVAGLAIQVAGRLVAKQQGRVGDDGAG